MPAKPRSPYHEDSPLTNAPRSMPTQKKPPEPVSTPTERLSSASSSSRALPTPSASAALTAFRTSGRLSVIKRTLPSRSVRTGSVETAASAALIATLSSFGNLRSLAAGCSGGEQLQVWLALAAQDLRIDLHAGDPARLGEHARLRLDALRSEHAATGPECGIDADPLEVTGQLLDRVDRRDALDLHSDPLVLAVPAHEVDRTDVRGPLAPHQAQALAAPLRGVGEKLLQLALKPLLLQAGQRVELVLDVGEDLSDRDLEPLLLTALAGAATGPHEQPLEPSVRAGLLLDDRRCAHPVQRLDARAAAI